MNQKGNISIYILLSLFILIAITVIYYFSQNLCGLSDLVSAAKLSSISNPCRKTGVENVTKVENTTNYQYKNAVITITPTPANDSSGFNTSNWKIYTSNSCGYSIKYPPLWTKTLCGPDQQSICLESNDYSGNDSAVPAFTADKGIVISLSCGATTSQISSDSIQKSCLQDKAKMPENVCQIIPVVNSSLVLMNGDGSDNFYYGAISSNIGITVDEVVSSQEGSSKLITNEIISTLTFPAIPNSPSDSVSNEPKNATTYQGVQSYP